MENLRFRQVHLDFHTSEAIGGIGKNFSREQFQKALKLGHVDSITVFSKCHHGWAYHPSKANEMHPGLDFDLLGEMIDAAHEIGVKTPVYLSAGLDEKITRRHPEWLVRREDEKIGWITDFMTPGYHLLCMNTPYLDYLLKQVEEVVHNYDADGIFMDIVGERMCYCQYCVASLRKEGKDPRDASAVRELGRKVYANYTKSINDVVNSIKPGMRIFHNGGHISRGRREMAAMHTHLELESLPTGGWGYDHFPLSARYAQTLGMEFLGMTGKFHTTWGEFGGYKHPNALRYETALSIANGARCSVGDQLHPGGMMDEATYALIGAGYSEVEVKESWCTGVNAVTDVALLSSEAAGKYEEGKNEGKTGKIDAGAVRILLESKILFDVVDTEEDFHRYKVLILPDNIVVGPKLKDKLAKYLNNGGKVLATGDSALNNEGTALEVDFGVKVLGTNPYNPDYFRPAFKLKSLEPAAYIMYSKGQRLELDGGTELGRREDPYFNRDLFTFCSHQHTPNSEKYGGPGMVENKNGIYIAWRIFEDYAVKGSIQLKEIVVFALNRLLGNRKTLETNLPAQGVATLMEQKENKRFVNHLLYAAPVKRGERVEVIEDLIPLRDIDVTLKLDRTVKRVYLAPQMQEIQFSQSGNEISYTVQEFECHQMVVLDVE